MKLLLATLLALATTARSENVSLAWDANTDYVRPGVNLRYRIELTRSAPWADAGQWRAVAANLTDTRWSQTVTSPTSFRVIAYWKEAPHVQSPAGDVLHIACIKPRPPQFFKQ